MGHHDEKMFGNVILERKIELDGQFIKVEFDPTEISEEKSSQFTDQLLELASCYGVTKLRFNSTGSFHHRTASTKVIRNVFGFDE